MNQSRLELNPAIKKLNVAFIASAFIGVFSGIAEIINANITIKPLSFQIILTSIFISVCLMALVMLGICETIDQKYKLFDLFKDSAFALKKSTRNIILALGVLTNIVMFVESAFLVGSLIRHHSNPFYTYHEHLVETGAAMLAIGCMLHCLFSAFCLIVWSRKFTSFLNHQELNSSRMQVLIESVSSGIGSFSEQVFGWAMFAIGMVIIALIPSGKVHFSSSFLYLITPSIFFFVGLFLLFLAFAGGHSNSQCLRKLHQCISPMKRISKSYLIRKYETINELAGIINQRVASISSVSPSSEVAMHSHPTLQTEKHQHSEAKIHSVQPSQAKIRRKVSIENHSAQKTPITEQSGQSVSIPQPKTETPVVEVDQPREAETSNVTLRIN